MIPTHHMASRMQQRAISSYAVGLALELGEYDNNDGHIVLGVDVIDEEIRRLGWEMEEAKRLRRRGGVTVIADGDTLITTYDRSRKSRRRMK